MKTLSWSWSSLRAPQCRAAQSSDILWWSQGCMCLDVFSRLLWCNILPCTCLLPCFRGRGVHYLTRQVVPVPGTGHFPSSQSSLNLTMSHSAQLKHLSNSQLRCRGFALAGVSERHRKLMTWPPFRFSGRTSRPHQSQGSLVSCVGGSIGSS